MSERLLKESDVIAVCDVLPKLYGEAIKLFIRRLPSAGRPSAVDLSSVYSTAYKSGYEKSKADRTQGEWLKDENGDYRCSECGGCEEQFIYGTENWYGRGESKFCPSCGARMKGADDDRND